MSNSVIAVQTLAAEAAEAEQTDGKAGKMTNTRSHRRIHPGLFARETANLAPHHGLRTRWVHHTVLGQGSLRHYIHSCKTSIWHPLEQPCLERVKGFGKTTPGLLRDMVESSPPSWALSHHCLHCHWCTKDPQLDLPSRGRLPNLCLFPKQQPDRLIPEHPPCFPCPQQV